MCFTLSSWGSNIGWNAVCEPQLRKNQTFGGLGFDEEEISWIGASFSIGGLLGALSAGKKTSFLACEKRTAFIFTTQSFFQLASPKSSAEFQENFSLFRNHLRAVWTKSCSSMVGLFGLYYMALYQPVVELLLCYYSPNNSGI